MKFYIYLLILILNVAATVGESAKCEAASNCKKCLETGGECYWCASKDYTAKHAMRPRCNTKDKLVQMKCSDIQIKDGKIHLDGDIAFSDKIQVRPQKVKVTLRPGQKQTFTLNVQPAENFPVRLYYLMDMSSSMKDDLDNLKKLGQKIANEMRNITKNFMLAFGTFVDKTVTPFIQLESKFNPCGKQKCEPTFGFKHVFNFNQDAKKFETAVAKEKISGNLDTPEGGFDALMQVAVCDKNIGWANIDEARRIVVFVSDATPHIAGDGKIGGITVPNDGKCHLNSKTPVAGMRYSKTNDMDYPSISQLKAKMKENKIVPIIAVTKDVEPIYQKLAKAWEDLGASIGPLERDSSNIVQLIRENYKKISTTVRLVDDSPTNLKVRYTVKNCPTAKPDEPNVCTGVAIKQKVEFQVMITAIKCLKDWKTTQNFTITVPGFGDVKVEANMICQCDCESGGVPKSPYCNKTGTYKCGICYCDKERYGQRCECDRESQADTSQCKMPNTTSICSDAGSCVCGKCECANQTDPSKIISGTYCQCNNFGCDRYNGKICGGKERGDCVCGICKCKDKYLGENCGKVNCKLGRKKCMKDGVECSNNGKCACDICACNTGYNGKYCENCVACGKCDAARQACVLCHPEYGIGDKAVCDKCKLNIVIKNETQNQCMARYNDTCRVYFAVSELNGNETVIVESKNLLHCVIVVKTEAPILIIVLGIIGGIVLIGLLLLLLGKLIIMAYDNHEYRQFQKDRMKSKWENAENPIYRPSKQQFQNPAYAGNK